MAEPFVPRVYTNKQTQLRAYKERLGAADTKFEERKTQAEKALKRYRNEPTMQQISGAGHRVNVPTGIAIIDAMFSSLTAVEIEFLVKNVGRGTRDQAAIASVGLQEVWRETKGTDKSDAAVKDALLIGVGWTKVGYEYTETTETQPRDRDDVMLDVNNLLSQAAASGETPDFNQVSELVPLEEEVQVVTRDRIVLDHVPWDSIRYDRLAKRVEDIRWVAQISMLPEYEVKGNESFRQYARENGNVRKLDALKPDSKVKEIGATGESDDERIAVVEFWDFETGTVTTFTRYHDLILMERPNPLAFQEDIIDRCPFVPLVLRKDPDSVWGISDMDVVLPSLEELDVLRSNLATYIERHKSKLLGPEGGLTEAGKEALKSPESGEYVEYSQDAQGPQSFDNLDPPNLPQEAFALETRVEDATREATGVNELMRGLFPDRKRTATETAEVVSASSVRQAERRNLMSRWYKDIGRRILSYMMMFYDQPRVARLVDVQGDIEWEWTNEDIAMEADLEIVLSPKEAGTRQERRDMAFTIINLLMNMPEEMVDQRQVLAWALEEIGIDPEAISLMLLSDPEKEEAEVEQAQRQAEMSLASQGIPPDTQPEAVEAAEEAGAAAQGVDMVEG